ncbi:MAG TPA: hypothetical protein VFG15_07820 [Amycolatopsis sp.]|nr:hypothetical protein [Amycolatopsis sp.]
MIGRQPLDTTARLDSSGPVPAGGTSTPAAITGTATFDTVHNATIFSAANYDGLRGKVKAPLTATNTATAVPGSTVGTTLEFHKRESTGAPWTLGCTVENTDPAQNRAFAPAIPVV